MGECRLLNIATITFVLVICIIMFINLASFTLIQDNDLLSIESPLIFAFLVGIVIFICLIITIVGEFREIRENKESYQVFNREANAELVRVAVYSFSLFVFVSLFKYIHFNVSTAIFMFIGMFLLNNAKESILKKAYKAFGATLITVPLLYLVFHEIFKVMLP